VPSLSNIGASPLTTSPALPTSIALTVFFVSLTATIVFLKPLKSSPNFLGLCNLKKE